MTAQLDRALRSTNSGHLLVGYVRGSPTDLAEAPRFLSL